MGSTTTSKNDIIPSNNIANATNNNDVNITISKVLHSNQNTESYEITKENDVYSNDNSKNVAEEQRSRKLAIKKKKKVFILGNSMVKFKQGWEVRKKLDNKRNIYVRHFSRSKVNCMNDYVKPCICKATQVT